MQTIQVRNYCLRIPPLTWRPCDLVLDSANPIVALLVADDRCHHHHHSIDLRALHAATITSGLIMDTFAASRIVRFFLRWGPRYAPHVFNSIHHPDVYTWNSMIAAHTEWPELSINYYFKMLDMGSLPNNYTFALIVKACSLGTDIWLGRKVHGQILKHGMEDLLVVRNSLMKMYCNMAHIEEAQLLFDTSFDLDLISWNSMISVYGKAEDVEYARRLFEKMPQRNLISWTAMIDAYVRNGSFMEALQLFNDMQVVSMKPDAATLVCVLKACAHLGALDQGRWVHIYVERNNIGNGTNVILCTALIDMYAKCGCIDVALDVFRGVHVRDVTLWNAMIGGLAMHGLGHDALDLFSRMKGCGVVPNEITFISVLCACTHVGLLREGLEIFNSMKIGYGIEPRSEHYGCLADLLGRAGLVQEAEEVLIKMPMQPQASQWGALMAACRTHNNVEVGERVGKHLIALEPHDGGRYVLLSNVYAGAGRWGDALETRRMMEEKGIKKERGCSFIEWNAVVHEFGVGDTNHPQSREIHELLGEMERRLKMVGYVHDTSQMLLDMCNEEDKEMAVFS
ncbi:pentatricopeptide repeat-containing protein At5g66520-like [Magnolia sinica]|uniref:pentatricopeptide repeat-containing protein At5g66520-like n=1 Tax=Magnolia sinica TaxID=86752 RepID=UPI0026597584|nr:pentatricopeptide repeat-containing protein At5g66520-like [Magnolia sinica]